MDESLEREGYEHSNAICRCQIHGVEFRTDIMGHDHCELCEQDSAMRMQELDDLEEYNRNESNDYRDE